MSRIRFWMALRTLKGVYSLTSKGLTISTAVCVAIIVINALWWDAKLEPFKGAALLVSAAIDLLLAYVAGYIFYVITSVYPDYKRKQFTYYTVMKRGLFEIAKPYAHLLEGLANNNKYLNPLEAIDVFGSYAGQQKLVRATSNLTLSCPSTAHNMSWIEFMSGVSDAEDRAINKILKFDTELELHVRLLLNDLLHSEYKQTINVLKSPAYVNSTLPFKNIVYAMHVHLGMLYALKNDIMDTMHN
ncbi:hypothetical protein [Aeromonas veronii]|uniref:hypothetical protein n=1 Tax=Aeromonas veronii TaxID=654 RepID=UPI00366F7052